MLKKIVEYKKRELADIISREPLIDIKSKINGLGNTLDFTGSLERRSKGLKSPRIIGEVKRASPSKGVIREDFNPLEIAKTYEESGISSISVLTDEHFFEGSIDYLQEIKKEVNVPVLRKDFIFDEYQIYRSRAYGADACLFIAAILERDQLVDYLHIANDLGLHTLVEIHDFKEMEQAFYAEDLIKVIGVNNRDLKTFNVDINITKKIAKEIPEDKVIVSESGIKNTDDIKALLQAGVDAFLIGETFMREIDIAKKVKEFFNVL